MDITRNARLRLFLVLFSMGFILSACNSGGGSINSALSYNNTEPSSPPKVDDPTDDGSQTATVFVIAESSVHITYYNNQRNMFFATMQSGDSSGYDPNAITRNIYESGGGSGYYKADSNKSWEFSFYSSANLNPWNFTWDSSCTSIDDSSATADLDCNMSQDTNTGTWCGLYSGDRNSRYSLRTPPGSNPSATFILKQLSNDQYHLSCTYTWNGPAQTTNNVYFIAGEGVTSLNATCANIGNSNNCNIENFYTEYNKDNKQLKLTYFAADHGSDNVDDYFAKASKNKIIYDRDDNNPFSFSKFFYIATNFYINGAPLLDWNMSPSNLFISEGAYGGFGINNLWYLGFIPGIIELDSNGQPTIMLVRTAYSNYKIKVENSNTFYIWMP